MTLRWYDTTAPWNDYRPHPKIYEKFYGHGMTVHDLAQPMTGDLRSGHFLPWLHHPPPLQAGLVKPKTRKDCFHVAVDVQHFIQNEIVVKIVDNELVVEATHEEKPDEHGYIYRHFLRRYHLPQDIQLNAMTSDLSSDGVLIISAPKMTLRWYDTTAPWNDYRPHPKIYEKFYGHGMTVHDLAQPMTGDLRSGHFLPWLHHPPPLQAGLVKPKTRKDCFHVAVDVQHFIQNEIVVKIVDNELVVEATHEEKPDEHGYIYRHFLRRYHLPQDIQLNAMTSDLSSDGVLIISAPKAPHTEDDNFRTVPVKKVGLPAIQRICACPFYPAAGVKNPVDETG